jgi:hypothetical protein
MDTHLPRNGLVLVALMAFTLAFVLPESIRAEETGSPTEATEKEEPSNALLYTGTTILILGLVTAIPGLILYDYDVGREDDDSPGVGPDNVALAGEISLYIAAGLTGAGLTMLILHGVFIEEREDVALAPPDFLVSPWVAPNAGGVSLQMRW